MIQIAPRQKYLAEWDYLQAGLQTPMLTSRKARGSCQKKCKEILLFQEEAPGSFVLRVWATSVVASSLL